MAERRRDWPTLNTHYIEGNTARKLDVSGAYEYETSPKRRQPEEVPAQRPVRKAAEPVRKPVPERKPAKKQAQRPAVQPKVYREPKERTTLMTPVFAVYTTAVLAVILFFAFRMLATQTALAAAAENVTALENTLMEINEENTKLEALVEAGVNLEHIYQVATEQLGLVSTDDSQIIYYDQIESGYVRQNEIIP